MAIWKLSKDKDALIGLTSDALDITITTATEVLGQYEASIVRGDGQILATFAASDPMEAMVMAVKGLQRIASKIIEGGVGTIIIIDDL